jgi:hypothetical protein
MAYRKYVTFKSKKCMNAFKRGLGWSKAGQVHKKKGKWRLLVSRY